MASFKQLKHQARHWSQRGLDALVRIGSTVLSNRGLAVMALLACAALCLGPWLRPAISRDFRGFHIPWSYLGGRPFFPPYAAVAPRPWLMNSVAVPVLLAIVAAILLVVMRRDRIAMALGLVLAVSIPAVSAALWNHPGLIEFFESEVRQRAVLREVFHHQSEELLTGGVPDRLATGGSHNTAAGHHSTVHPVFLPFRYSMYGPWMVAVACTGVLLASSGSLRHRLTYAGGWVAVGLLLAVAATWPRWVAEYHFMQAAAHEDAQQLAEAEQSLDRVKWAMPSLEFSRRYRLALGRVHYRQGIDDFYTAFFVAHQQALTGDYAEARNMLSPTINQDESSHASRELLAEILGHMAAEQVALGDFTAADHLWGEATLLAPWMPGHWIAQSTTALAANPLRAEELEQALMPRLVQVGDRIVNSDIASMIGDAYFNTGDFAKARSMYDRSIANFHLPKNANLKAQEGRLGM
ncbi:hypothetical protein NG895_26760 [Aeoliella sp. ICT_H6.2]|uniref:Tetratricopeptide repeat protein n=1 Tax=Aeoliella straminimaris TaxID=2954799 RepID=A0A9X2FJN2_9BACT|nr:hypothetical protein [Aeoliella straminimaris]MCO6047521.1 hypothetical protein [Aeoliella straminimaris]